MWPHHGYIPLSWKCSSEGRYTGDSSFVIDLNDNLFAFISGRKEIV